MPIYIKRDPHAKRVIAPNPNLGVQTRIITMEQKIKATLIDANSHVTSNPALPSHNWKRPIR